MKEKIKIKLKTDWDSPPKIDNGGHFVGREEELSILVNELIRKNSGSILISGERGVGKTALVYKALQTLLKQSKGNKTITPVILNASQLNLPLEPKQEEQEQEAKAPVFKLKEEVIKNLIRRLYTATYKIGGDLKGEIDKLYMKAVSSDVKILKEEVISDEESEEEEGEKGFGITERINFVQIFKILGLGSALFFMGAQPLSMIWNQVAIFSSILVAILPAEIFFSFKKIHKTIKDRKKKKSAAEYYEQDYKNIGNLEFDLEQLLDKLSGDYKIIFVIDELDKIAENKYVLNTIKVFKNLFTLSSAIFVFITGPEVFREIQQNKESRGVEYTLFTHKMFLTRPRFLDLEKFLDDIVDSPDITTIKNNFNFKNFKNYVCYLARTHFFDIYTVLRDFIVKFDDKNRPEIIVEELIGDPLLYSRIQKIIGLTYDSYRSSKQSEWSLNNDLLTFLYGLADDILSKKPSEQIEDKHEGEEIFINIKKDFYKLLARCEALKFIDERDEQVGTVKQHIKKYQWTGSCETVPTRIQDKTEFEMKFLNQFHHLLNKSAEVINVLNKFNNEKRINYSVIENDPVSYLQKVNQLSGLNILEIFNQTKPVRDGLSQYAPEHYKREIIETHIKNIENSLVGLKNNSKIIIENILKEIFPSLSFTPLQSNDNLFSVIADLRNNVINSNIQNNVLYKPDFSKQLLVVLNLPPEHIDQVKSLIIQNRNTLKILNIITDETYKYVPSKRLSSVLFNVSIKDNFEIVIPLLSKVIRWLS